MWEYMELPINVNNLRLGEQLVEQCATTKMREYSGTVFLCCSPASSLCLTFFAIQLNSVFFPL